MPRSDPPHTWAEKLVMGAVMVATPAAFWAFVELQIVKSRLGDLQDDVAELQADFKHLTARTLTRDELKDELRDALRSRRGLDDDGAGITKPPKVGG